MKTTVSRDLLQRIKLQTAILSSQVTPRSVNRLKREPIEFWKPPEDSALYNESDFLLETPVPEPERKLQIVDPVVDGVFELVPSTPDIRFPNIQALNAYLEEKHHKIKSKLISDQWTAVVRSVWFYGICQQNCQVIAPTGQGKTYYLAALLHILAAEFPERFSIFHPTNHGRGLPVVIVPPKVIAQTQMVFAEYEAMALITSLASLRSSLGENMIEFRTVMVNHQPTIYPFFIKHCSTLLMVVDESQQVKNEDSIQSKIIESCAACGIPTHFMSATPYSRVSQAKIIACALMPLVPNPGHELAAGIRLTEKIWPSFAKSVCPNSVSPSDWSPAALKKLQFYLEPLTIRWAIPYPHKVITKIVSCKFASVDEQEIYNQAFNEWNEVRLRRELDPLVGVIAELVALQKFNQCAEELRAPHIVRAGVELWNAKEKAHLKDKRKKPVSIIFGFAYKTSLDRAAAALEMLLGLEEFKKKVAIICGGRNCDRDKDAFQADKKPFLLLTIASGGAGLSLDHNQYNKRQRYMFCSAVWNDIQMAQLAGRTQRLKTKSASYMYIMYYEGTKEYEKLQKVLYKVKCLKEVTTKVGVVGENDRAGNFVDDINQLEYHNSGNHLSAPADEAAEESAAEVVVGTRQVIEFDIDKTGERDEEDQQVFSV